MSKISDLRDANPEFAINLIDDLSTRDPSGNNKYLPFMVKISQPAIKEYFTSKQYLDDTFKQLIDLVADFHKYSDRGVIENKDIYSYTDIKAVQAAIVTAKERDSMRDIKEDQTLVLYEDADKILVKPLTAKSAIMYGKNTKWCTSAKELSNNSFTSYASDGYLVYFIYKRNFPSNAPQVWRKIGFNHQNQNTKEIIWDALSKEVELAQAMKLFALIGTEIMNIVIKEGEMNIPNTYLGKNTKGEVILDEEIFRKDRYKRNEREIREYVATLQDKRFKSNRDTSESFNAESEAEVQMFGEEDDAIQASPSTQAVLDSIGSMTVMETALKPLEDEENLDMNLFMNEAEMDATQEMNDSDDTDELIEIP